MIDHSSPLTTGLKLLFAVALMVISYPLFTQNQPWLFIDGVNLLFHEAGHLIFSPFGQGLGRLGGTLMQLIIPAITLAAFVRQRSWFSATFSLWWLGENLVNIAVYIKDASARVLPLVGNGDHDWYWLLSQTHLIASDQFIGNGVLHLAQVLIVFALFGLLVLPMVPHAVLHK